MASRIPARVEGWGLALRLVTTADAEYIYSLRTNPIYNSHLSVVKGTVEDQRSWIDVYKKREAEGIEAYYIIERLMDGVSCGVVRLYNIMKTCFTWGSWILDANKPPKAALESAVLSFDIGFEDLDKNLALLDVRRENHKALQFYRRFGMTEVKSDAIDIYFNYTREQFSAAKPYYLRVLSEHQGNDELA